MCPYPPHREKEIKHKIKECKACLKNDKKKYIKEYVESKNNGNEVQWLRRKPTNDSSLCISAVFQYRHRAQVCVDNGADGNIMDKRTIAKIRKAGAVVQTSELCTPRAFGMAEQSVNGKRVQMVCTTEVTTDTKLRIRHGFALLIRNLHWLVTKQHVSEPLNGRSIHEALGLNPREMLVVSADRFCGSVDAENVLVSIETTATGACHV